jgi:hypothetical protein
VNKGEKMKKINLICVLIISFCQLNILFAQNENKKTEYSITPGSKGNQIILLLENSSNQLALKDIIITMQRASSSIIFLKEKEEISVINPSGQKELIFTFDVERNVTKKKDTVSFYIYSIDGITPIEKSFIFNYIVPDKFLLEQNFPNPFNPTTTIYYQLSQDSNVRLVIYDILGREVLTLVNEMQKTGYYSVELNSYKNNLASGVYIYRIISIDNITKAEFISQKKMIVLK